MNVATLYVVLAIIVTEEISEGVRCECMIRMQFE